MTFALTERLCRPEFGVRNEVFGAVFGGETLGGKTSDYPCEIIAWTAYLAPVNYALNRLNLVPFGALPFNLFN